MKLAHVSYYISDTSSPDKRRLVEGFAVDAPSPLRFCIRHGDFFEDWRADHWETGFAFGGRYVAECNTAEAAAMAAIGVLTAQADQIPRVVERAKALLGDAYPLNPEPTA